MDRDHLIALGEHPKDADRVLARLEPDSDDIPDPDAPGMVVGELTGEFGD